MRRRFTIAALILLICVPGCRSKPLKSDRGVRPFQPFMQQIEYPDVTQASCAGIADDLMAMPAPPSVRHPDETPKWEMTLEEAIRIALSNSQVIRDLGGRVVSQGSDATPTVFEPALQETDPRFGVEAALSAFDTQFYSNMYLERIDRRFNNLFFASAGAQRQQNQFQTGITKTTAVGTQLTIENLTNYEAIQGVTLEEVRSRGNLYERYYETIFQARIRHPLLQGAGVEFNRIAGPNATAGNYNGVVLARIDADISISQFEGAVRDLLREVEQTYWELYFAYQDLHTKEVGRDKLLQVWQLEQRRLEVGTGRIDDEATARESYFNAQALVENALTTGGVVAFGSGGTTRSQGVYGVENQLRSLLGIPATDGTLIVPVSEPVQVDVQFDWGDSLAQALTRRVELRRQQWRIKRRQMELIAARNFRHMRLDLIGEYRFRGFGNDLLGNGAAGPFENPDDPTGPDVFFPKSAFKDLFSGDYQEYRVGLELTAPVGNRLGHTAIRNAELRLTRERAILDQMQLRIATDLRTSFTEVDRAYQVSKSNYNRAQAVLVRTRAESRRERVGEGRLDPVLQAVRQYVDADIQFHRSIIDYNLSLLNLHYTRGSLFDYHRVYLAEGPWVPEAHASAAKQSRRFRPAILGGKHVEPGHVSRGPVPPITETYEVIPTPGEPASSQRSVPGERRDAVEEIPVPPSAANAAPPTGTPARGTPARDNPVKGIPAPTVRGPSKAAPTNGPPPGNATGGGPANYIPIGNGYAGGGPGTSWPQPAPSFQQPLSPTPTSTQAATPQPAFNSSRRQSPPRIGTNSTSQYSPNGQYKPKRQASPDGKYIPPPLPPIQTR